GRGTVADAARRGKTRVLAGGSHSAKQQGVRIDRRQGPISVRAVHQAFSARLERALARCDAVVVSDYGAGLVTPRLVARIQRLVRQRRGERVPILVHSRYALDRFTGLTASTPDQSAAGQPLGLRVDDNARVLETAGRTLLARTGLAAVLITRSSRGMALFQPDVPTVHVPTFGSDEIADVTGAGDTVIATMTLALAAGATFEEAARLANFAGGLVVMKRGTATVSIAELRDAVERGA